MTQDQPEGLASVPTQGGTWSVDPHTWRVLWSDHTRLIHEAAAGHEPTVWEALEYIDARDRPGLFAATLACILRQQPFRQEVTLRTAHGTRKRVELDGTPAVSPGGAPTVAGTIRVLRDPVPLGATEWELDDLLDQLRDWELFGHAIPHELGSPVAAVRGFALALDAADEPLSERGRDHLRRILRAGDRLDGLLQGIFQFAALPSRPLRAQTVDLSRIAEECVAALREAEPRRDVRVEIEPGVRAYGDATLLRLVLHNLLSNAWRVTRRTAGATVRFGVELHDLRIIHCVRDNGPGFAIEDSPRLFLPFQRLHGRDHYDGAGIGLALVRRAIERHGGSVWAHSAPGQGACFCFALPPSP